MRKVCALGALVSAAAMGCSSVDDPSASSEEATSSVEEALRDGKDKKDMNRKKDKDDCVRDAKFDLDFWGKTDKDRKSFWDFVHDKKDDGKKETKLFKDQKEAFLGDNKKAERVFKDLFEQSKHKFFDKKDLEKKDFDRKKDFDFDKKFDFDRKEDFDVGKKFDFNQKDFDFDLGKKFDFDQKNLDKKVIYGPTMDGADMMLWWGGDPSWGDMQDGNDAKDDDNDD